VALALSRCTFGLSGDSSARVQGTGLFKGSLALLVFVALAVLIKFPKTPDWVLGSVGMLLLLLCLLTMAFLFQQGYRGIRRRLSKSD
jgi:hypothetical protein